MEEHIGVQMILELVIWNSWCHQLHRFVIEYFHTSDGCFQSKIPGDRPMACKNYCQFFYIHSNHRFGFHYQSSLSEGFDVILIVFDCSSRFRRISFHIWRHSIIRKWQILWCEKYLGIVAFKMRLKVIVGYNLS